MRRDRVAAVVALAILLLVILVSRRGGDPRPAEEAATTVAEPAAPTLAVAPARAPRAGSTTPTAPAEGDAEAPPTTPKILWIPGGSTEDDPALPKDRVPLEAEIVDPRGAPVPGAAVQAVWGEWRTKAYVADERGIARLDVPKGARALEVVGVPPSETRRFLLVHYHSLSGGESKTRVEVRVGSEITGTLVRTNGTPIVGGQVCAIPAAWGFGPATTDGEGKFHLDVLEGTEVDVEFHGALDVSRAIIAEVTRAEEAVERADRGAAEDERAPLAVARRVAAGTTDLRLVATPARMDAVLHLRVTLWDGAPATGAKVWFPIPGGNGRLAVEQVGASGRSTIPNLPPCPVSVNVELDGHQDFGGLMPDGSEHELKLRPKTELRGRAVDANGRPVAGAWCAALRGHEYLAAFGTDAEGRFSTTLPVAPGTKFQLTARFPPDEDAATARGVLNDVIAGREEPTVVIEEVGLLLAPGRRRTLVVITFGSGDAVISGFQFRTDRSSSTTPR